MILFVAPLSLKFSRILKCYNCYYYVCVLWIIEMFADIDECVENTHSCRRHDQECRNTQGGFSCIDTCPQGFHKAANGSCIGGLLGSSSFTHPQDPSWSVAVCWVQGFMQDQIFASHAFLVDTWMLTYKPVEMCFYYLLLFVIFLYTIMIAYFSCHYKYYYYSKWA
jgi:hypothetical protein